MSAIYWHSEHDEQVWLSGAERAHMGVLLSDLAAAVFAPLLSSTRAETPPPVLRIVEGNSYLHSTPWSGFGSGPLFESRFRTWLMSGDHCFVMQGKLLPSFGVVLNTALCMGGDALRLFARLHGQCEIHAYVEGPNRGWLADIIEAGRQSRILRPDMGWESVVALLRERDDEPVVTSYSVCDGFPNRHVSSWEPSIVEDTDEDDAADRWYDLSVADQWRYGMEGLRASSGGLELTPERWETFYFGAGVNAFELSDYALAAAGDGRGG